ncbi:peptide deformylase [Paenibacillus sp. HN-1]|uniref:peptide deformylase n=1 Tax=Paenibacillus TaxID=44249 RepID=UPI001CA89133|nr:MULTISPECIES: peptide deformylase [Paenibacillus]MBY9079834.1 peptide deformylase [Paenibacillus sp. CGMCC 1.18879]MBY9084475.1 peptide deformylase [Paenibacillus sinensis]
MLTMDDIVREGHPALREVAEPVPMPLSQEDRDTLHCMLQFLKNSQDEDLAEKYKLRSGVGLSANQIGLNKRMFVMYTSDEQGRLHEHALVNPKIISHSVSMIYLPESEGCLSVDRPIQGFVPRYESVKVKAYDLCTEQAVLLKFKGYTSIVVQHEMDHLDGVMFYDRINQENPFKLPPNVPIRSLYNHGED